MTDVHSMRRPGPASLLDPAIRLWPALRRGLGRLVDAVNREMVIRRDARHLASLPDETLRDIGITRGEIARLVRYGAPR